jgi:hypothetical protein
MKGPHEDELDARLSELFRSADRPEPSRDFVSRTMNAVRVEPLPAGRQTLRRPWTAPLAWAVLVGSAAAAAYALLIGQPFPAELVASTVGVALHVSTRLLHLVGVGLALSELFATVGHAVARAAATREGTTLLMLIAAVAGTSLLGLQRMFSDREVSQWKELS